MIKTVKNLKDKGRTNDSMLLYGYGDGGGGPTYVSNVCRIKSLSSKSNFPILKNYLVE